MRSQDFARGAMPEKMSWLQLHVTNPCMKWLSKKLARIILLPVINEVRHPVCLFCPFS